jgi:RND family efflux transporter MFP subunit
MNIYTMLLIAIVFGVTTVTGYELPLSWDNLSFKVATAAAAESEPKSDRVDPKTQKKIKYWVAPMDPTFVSNEPGKSPMGMDLVPVYEEDGDNQASGTSIRIDPVMVQNMGIRVGKVTKKPLTKNIRTVGTVNYNETQLFIVNSKFNGWIEKLHVDFVGENVVKGQPLFDIYSPEVLTAQQEYLLAFDQYLNLPVNASDSIKGATQRMLTASRNRLLYWDLDESFVKQLETSGVTQKTVTISSPATGVVIKKNAFEGHYVKTGLHQYEIADLSTVWVDVDIYEYELPWVHKGMSAEMELAYIPGKIFKGEVLFVYPYLDMKTRTAKLRLSFTNFELELKPGMYANVNLEAKSTESTLVIPQEAIIDSGVRKVVFIALPKGRFQAKEVRVGVEGNDYEIQILEGLSEGDNIVLSGQFLLDSESRLREAIQKMLEVRNSPSDSDEAGLGKSGMDMDKPDEAELDMSNMDMDDSDEHNAGK